MYLELVKGHDCSSSTSPPLCCSPHRFESWPAVVLVTPAKAVKCLLLVPVILFGCLGFWWGHWAARPGGCGRICSDSKVRVFSMGSSGSVLRRNLHFFVEGNQAIKSE